MDFFSDPQQNVVKLEEKEERICEFVSYYVERLSVTDPADMHERTVTMIALSPDSPVAKGLSANMDELIAAGISLQVVFARLSPSEALSEWIEPELVHRHVFQDNGLSGTRVSTVRHAKRHALKEAHEQLTLGSSMSWAGDSMRREPTKRDAYECYDIDSPEAVVLARSSFGHIWNVCNKVETSATSMRTPSTEKVAPTIGTEPRANGEKPIRTNKSPSAPSRH